MGIEMRKNGIYYYRKTWRNGRCVSEYAGRGDIAIIRARLDEEERQERQARDAQRRRLREALAAEQREAQRIEDAARELARLALAATGHRLHKGQWRRRRFDPMTRPTRTAAPDTRPPLPAAGDTSDEAVSAILTRALHERATDEDQRALRRLLLMPVVPKKVDYLLHFCRLAQTHIVDDEIKAKGATRTALFAEMIQMRTRLGYDQAPELERGLIEHVVTCYMRLQVIEVAYGAKTTEGGTFAQMDYWERRLTAAQQRYLRAVEMLARVRRVRVELVRVTSPDGTRAEGIAVERPAD